MDHRRERLNQGDQDRLALCSNCRYYNFERLNVEVLWKKLGKLTMELFVKGAENEGSR